MNSYRELTVWQKSVILACEVYKLTDAFPKAEVYGIVSQLRRAAVSVPSNIAEGFSRKSIRENAQFISIAFGSTSELDTQLVIAKELQMTRKDLFVESESILVEVRKMLNVMLSRLKIRSSTNG